MTKLDQLLVNCRRAGIVKAQAQAREAEAQAAWREAMEVSGAALHAYGDAWATLQRFVNEANP